MEDCVFCRIVNGELPSSKVYENEKVVAFLDISPVNKGHTLVIAKEHHKTMMDLPDDLLKEVIVAAKRVSKAVMDATGAGGISIALSNHEVAGQAVPHAHFHVIPRFKGDGLKLWPQGEYSEGEMKEYMERIKKSFK